MHITDSIMQLLIKNCNRYGISCDIRDIYINWLSLISSDILGVVHPPNCIKFHITLLSFEFCSCHAYSTSLSYVSQTLSHFFCKEKTYGLSIFSYFLPVSFYYMYIAWLIHGSWRWRQCLPPKVRWTDIGQHLNRQYYLYYSNFVLLGNFTIYWNTESLLTSNIFSPCTRVGTLIVATLL